MERDEKTALVIVLSTFGCLGCGGLLAFFAVFGFGFLNDLGGGTSPVMSPVSAPTVPVGAVPSGWLPYVHASQCPANPNLRLTQLRAGYPANFEVLPCHDQQPRPWSYVTFHLEDAEGSADKQITLGFSRGLPTQSMLQSSSAQVVSQLGSPSPRLIDESPFVARGLQNLTRRDEAFTLSVSSGVFAPGSYIIRQVVVPGPGPNNEGINVVLIHRVRTTEAGAVLESTAMLRQVVNSIQL